MSIPFRQYLRPDGRPRPIEIERPEHVETLAESVMKTGIRFEAEILRTAEISLTAYDPQADSDIAVEIVKNGEEVEAAVDRLVSAAAKMKGLV